VSPCMGGTSRWRRNANTTCPSPTAGIDSTTLATLQTALLGTSDPNPYVRDILLTGAGCNDTAGETIGAQVPAGPDCFEHIHPHELDVRDFSEWVQIHDGNMEALLNNRPNPIARFAEGGLTLIAYPGHHPMSRWNDRQALFPKAGRFGDDVDFTALNTELQTVEMASRIGAVANINEVLQETCGSPNEVADEPKLGHYYHTPTKQPGSFQRNQLDFPYNNNAG